ncbi:hypothetical protein BHC44_04265 [Snodgrassella alvi]|jgi:hypothetical protein|nr:hypothetical protein BHC44_04265 [Snodgrassella alvi]
MYVFFIAGIKFLVWTAGVSCMILHLKYALFDIWLSMDGFWQNNIIKNSAVTYKDSSICFKFAGIDISI